MKILTKFNIFKKLKKETNPLDPYGEEEWEEDSVIFKNGDRVILADPYKHFYPCIKDEESKWLLTSLDSSGEYRVVDTANFEDVDGYTGQVIKIYGFWPWFQKIDFKLE